MFCFKLCKCIHVSDCLLSSQEQFFVLIPRYTSFTYSTDNGFKLLLRRVNFITVLDYSLYVSLTLIILTTDIASIIQRALFGSVDSQVLLTSDNYGYEVLDFA